MDRSAIPYPDSQPEVAFPAFERATLDNGLTLIVANWPAVPVVNLALQLDAGYAADVVGDARLGTASLTLDMMDEGAGDLDALEIGAALDRLGATLTLGADLDSAVAGVTALKANLAETLVSWSSNLADWVPLLTTTTNAGAGVSTVPRDVKISRTNSALPGDRCFFNVGY